MFIINEIDVESLHNMGDCTLWLFAHLDISRFHIFSLMQMCILVFWWFCCLWRLTGYAMESSLMYITTS